MSTSNSHNGLRNESGLKSRPPNFQDRAISVGLHNYPSMQIYGHTTHNARYYGPCKEMFPTSSWLQWVPLF